MLVAQDDRYATSSRDRVRRVIPDGVCATNCNRCNSSVAGVEDSTMINTYKTLIQLNPEVANHIKHPWRQVGRCVYCGPCGVRLYSGIIPDKHPKEPKPIKAVGSDPASAMLAKWNKL